MLNPIAIRIRGQHAKGQGVIEYAGAMIVAAFIVGALISGVAYNSWIWNFYNATFLGSGNVIYNNIGNL